MATPITAPPPRRRLCFHCGQPGHRASACPSPQPRSEEGEAAFRTYVNARQKLAALRVEEEEEDRQQKDVRRGLGGGSTALRREGLVNADNKGSRKPLHHFDRVVEWMQHANDDDGDENDGPDLQVVVARDPIAVLRSEAAEAEADSVNTTTTQRWHDLHNAKRKDLHHSYRELFHETMTAIRHRLASVLGVTESDERASLWKVELRRAVREGRPGDFSTEKKVVEGGDDDDDGNGSGEGGGGRCLKVYAVEKLAARCRQLHHLMFDDNPYSEKVRSMLLPFSTAAADAIADVDRSSPIKVVSLGGGPGYDHVALCLAARFLRRVQPNRGAVLRTRRISTRVFDLFDEDWRPVLAALGESCYEVTCGDEDEELGEEGNNDDSGSGRDMTMSHADLRLGLDEPIHSDLAQAVAAADIICVQFVLHENAAFLLSEDGSRVGGAIGDILRRSSLGTLLFCTDSANTLWPALKATAADCGWIYMSDEDVEKKIVLGPKSFVMLERVKA